MITISSEQHSRFMRLASERSIAIIIPARNEAKTVGEITRRIVSRYSSGSDTDMKIVVIDDHSQDNTAEIAARNGACVISRSSGITGKAEAVHEGIRRFPSDIYILFDADVPNFDPGWLELLCLGLENPSTVLSKAKYRRPVKIAQSNSAHYEEGGRVTELVARPLLSLFFPELAHLGQPLSGEMAFRSTLVKSIPLSVGYGFDIGLLIDAYLEFGRDSIEEIDLGEREHFHQPLASLSFQARQVANTILTKSGIDISSFPGAEKIIKADGSVKKVPFGVLPPPDPM